MDNSAYAALYERVVHPSVLAPFTRRSSFEEIFQELRALSAPPSVAAEGLVLDLACGTGWFGRRLVREARATGTSISVLAVDASPAMLARARRIAARDGLTEIEHVEADVQRLTMVASGAADEIWLCGALHLIPDPHRTLAEVARVAKPGAVLLCQTFVRSERAAIRSPSSLASRFGFTFFELAELEHLIHAAGLAAAGIRRYGAVVFFAAKRPESGEPSPTSSS
jgi:ubiquinone/menaquinone biosynthesis C-methylase UbiE